MPRLIDADKIEPTELYNGEWVRVAYMDDIDELPTVDAEPVVRCKDCRFWHNRAKVCLHPCLSFEGTFPVRIDGNDYCSWGERREDENN